MSNKKQKSVSPAQQKKPNATQRIGDLERKIEKLVVDIQQVLTQTDTANLKKFEIVASELDKLAEMARSTDRRVTIMLDNMSEGDSLKAALVNAASEELETKVAGLVQAGALVREDERATDSKTFLVGRELDTEGNVVNPRIQFAVGSLDESIQEKLNGKVVGDLVQITDAEAKLELIELYTIQDMEKNLESEDQTGVVMDSQEAEEASSEDQQPAE